MSSFTLQSQVSDIVTSIPQTADLFRSLRIDFVVEGRCHWRKRLNSVIWNLPPYWRRFNPWRTSLPIIRKPSGFTEGIRTD